MIVASAPSPTRTTLRVATSSGSLPARSATSSTGFSSLALAAMSITAPSRAYAVLSASTASSSRSPTRSSSAAVLSSVENRRQRGDGDGAVGDQRRQIRRVEAVDEDDAMRVDGGERPQRRVDVGLGHARSLARRQRQRLFHQVAQVGVFPRFDAPMRQAERAEPPHGFGAHLAHLRRRPAARRRRRRMLRRATAPPSSSKPLRSSRASPAPYLSARALRSPRSAPLRPLPPDHHRRATHAASHAAFAWYSA